MRIDSVRPPSPSTRIQTTATYKAGSLGETDGDPIETWSVWVPRQSSKRGGRGYMVGAAVIINMIYNSVIEQGAVIL